MTETPIPICSMSFKPSNTVACRHGGRCFTGAPAGITFAVYPGGEEGWYTLVAPGYGAGRVGWGPSEPLMVCLLAGAAAT